MGNLRGDVLLFSFVKDSRSPLLLLLSSFARRSLPAQKHVEQNLHRVDVQYAVAGGHVAEVEEVEHRPERPVHVQGGEQVTAQLGQQFRPAIAEPLARVGTFIKVIVVRQNTVQLMTAGMGSNVTNLTPGSECNPTPPPNTTDPTRRGR
jgi:hypothetical protein